MKTEAVDLVGIENKHRGKRVRFIFTEYEDISSQEKDIQDKTKNGWSLLVSCDESVPMAKFYRTP